jgi:hypothetical protein
MRNMRQRLQFAAYGVIASFSTRIDMLREAAHAFFFEKKKDDLRDYTIDFLDMAKNLSSRRNEIAHGIVQRYYIKDTDGGYDVGYAVGPSFFAARKKRLSVNSLTNNNIQIRDSYAYTSIELRAFADYFAELADDALSLHMELSDKT